MGEAYEDCKAIRRLWARAGVSEDVFRGFTCIVQIFGASGLTDAEWDAALELFQGKSRRKGRLSVGVDLELEI